MMLAMWRDEAPNAARVGCRRTMGLGRGCAFNGTQRTLGVKAVNRPQSAQIRDGL